MHSVPRDQAEGLRRLALRSSPRVVSVLSAESSGDRAALLQRMAAANNFDDGRRTTVLEMWHTADSELHARRAAELGALVEKSGLVLVGAVLDGEDRLPLTALDSSEVIVQVSTSHASITGAYSLIKRLARSTGRKAFSVIVTGATYAEAETIIGNIAAAARRYLAVRIDASDWLESTEPPAGGWLSPALARISPPRVNAPEAMAILAGASVYPSRHAERI